MSEFYNNAIFWVEVDKIKPNPFQPRKEFDQSKLDDLARSIRQYGVIQPLTVTRKEVQKSDGGLASEYELIAGERRLRAAKIAGIAQVPVIIRADYEDDKTKLEVAIIENLQREDLNPIDRANAFAKLANEFGFKHAEIGAKVGKSREYVSNTIRLLMMPQEMQQALSEGKIAEGHTRPLLMLIDRPEEQQVLFREIMQKRLTVRDTDSIARRIAFDRVRKKEYLYAPEILEMERTLTEQLGTRVAIEPKENGGKLSIDFMSEDDLRTLFNALQTRLANTTASANPVGSGHGDLPADKSPEVASSSLGKLPTPTDLPTQDTAASAALSAQELPASQESVANLDDRSQEEKNLDENSFDPSNFSI